MGFVDALEQACSLGHVHVHVLHETRRWASATNTLPRTELSGWASLTMKPSLGEMAKCVCRSSPTDPAASAVPRVARSRSGACLLDEEADAQLGGNDKAADRVTVTTKQLEQIEQAFGARHARACQLTAVADIPTDQRKRSAEPCARGPGSKRRSSRA